MIAPYEFGFPANIVGISFPSGYFVIVEVSHSAIGEADGGGSLAFSGSSAVSIPVLQFGSKTQSVQQLYQNRKNIPAQARSTIYQIWNSFGPGLYSTKLVTGPFPLLDSYLTVAEADAAIKAYLGGNPAFLVEPATSGYSTDNLLQTIILKMRKQNPRQLTQNTAQLICNSFLVPLTTNTETHTGTFNSIGQYTQSILIGLFLAQAHAVAINRQLLPPGRGLGVVPPWPINWGTGGPPKGTPVAIAQNVDLSILDQQRITANYNPPTHLGQSATKVSIDIVPIPGMPVTPSTVQLKITSNAVHG